MNPQMMQLLLGIGGMGGQGQAGGIPQEMRNPLIMSALGGQMGGLGQMLMNRGQAPQGAAAGGPASLIPLLMMLQKR